MVKKSFEIASIFIVLLFCQLTEVRADDFILLESYPAQGQIVKPSDLVNNPIYLKFNHPVNRYYQGVIRLLDKTSKSSGQINMGGVVNFENNDTKLIWYPDQAASLFQPGYSFEIQIGDQNPDVPPVPYAPVLLMDTSGNGLPVTYIDFSVDKCQPIASLKVTDNNLITCWCDSPLGFDCHGNLSGYAITLTAGLTNPSCGSSLSVEGRVWLQLPDSSLLSLFDPPAVVPLIPGDSFSGDLLSYTFNGSEPTGGYTFYFRLLNSITGDFYSTATTGFTFGVCPAIF